MIKLFLTHKVVEQNVLLSYDHDILWCPIKKNTNQHLYVRTAIRNVILQIRLYNYLPSCTLYG